MWVARDKNGELWFFEHKPVKSDEVWGSAFIDDDILMVPDIDSCLFDDVQWEDEEPTEIRLVRKK